MCVTLYHMRVTSAMLADNALVADGKLYIHGGAWDRLTVSQVPVIANMALVMVVSIAAEDEALLDEANAFTLELQHEERGRILAGRGGLSATEDDIVYPATV